MFYEYTDLKYKTLCTFRKQLIPIIEHWLQTKDKVKYLFNLMVHRTTIIKIDKIGELGPKILIYATYPGKKILKCHANTLKEFEKNGYSVIIVTNNKYAEKSLKGIDLKNRILITRRPFGRDFGCYKEATLHILKHHSNIEQITKVVYFNDSIITLNDGLQKCIKHLDNHNNDFSGLTENYEFDYHVGSFALSLSGNAFRSKNTVKFWKKYRPVSTRRYSIHKGEMGLTKTIKKQGYIPSVLYKLSDYNDFLWQQSYLDLQKLYSSLSIRFRKSNINFFKPLNDVLGDTIGNSEQKQTLNNHYLSKFFKRQTQDVNDYSENQQIFTSTEDYDAHRLSNLRYRDKILGVSEDDQSNIAKIEVRKNIISTMLDYIFSGSQIHSACTILLYMKSGIIKKDIVFRCLIEPYDLKKIIRESGYVLDEQEITELIDEIIGKGHPYSFRKNPYKRVMYEWGFI